MLARLCEPRGQVDAAAGGLVHRLDEVADLALGQDRRRQLRASRVEVELQLRAVADRRVRSLAASSGENRHRSTLSSAPDRNAWLALPVEARLHFQPVVHDGP